MSREYLTDVSFGFQECVGTAAHQGLREDCPKQIAGITLWR